MPCFAPSWSIFPPTPARHRAGFFALAACYLITDNMHMAKRDNTLAQRQAAARQRLLAEGGRRVTLAVPGDLNSRLQAEMERTGESASAVILRLMRDNLKD